MNIDDFDEDELAALVDVLMRRVNEMIVSEAKALSLTRQIEMGRSEAQAGRSAACREIGKLEKELGEERTAAARAKETISALELQETGNREELEALKLEVARLKEALGKTIDEKDTAEMRALAKASELVNGKILEERRACFAIAKNHSPDLAGDAIADAIRRRGGW